MSDSPMETLDQILLNYDLHGLARPDTWLFSIEFARMLLHTLRGPDAAQVEFAKGKLHRIYGIRVIITDQDVDVIPAWTSPAYRQIRPSKSQRTDYL